MIAIAVSAALAIFFFVKGRARKPEAGLERLRRLSGDEAETAEPVGKRSRRLLLAVVEIPCRVLPSPLKEKLGRDLPKRVPLSGFTIEQLIGIRVWGTATLPLFALFAFRFSRAGLFFALPCVALGIWSPDLLAGRSRGLYLDSVRRALPHTADMLYAFVLGGRNLDQAFKGAAESSPEPLKSLLGQAVREMELGSTREESFKKLLERCPLSELSSLLRSLLEAERRGHRLTGTLEIFSREIRLRRRDQLRVAVAKAPLKLLAPLVFLILPASVILTVGPTFLATLQRSF